MIDLYAYSLLSIFFCRSGGGAGNQRTRMATRGPRRGARPRQHFSPGERTARVDGIDHRIYLRHGPDALRNAAGSDRERSQRDRHNSATRPLIAPTVSDGNPEIVA